MCAGDELFWWANVCGINITAQFISAREQEANEKWADQCKLIIWMIDCAGWLASGIWCENCKYAAGGRGWKCTQHAFQNTGRLLSLKLTQRVAFPAHRHSILFHALSNTWYLFQRGITITSSIPSNSFYCNHGNTLEKSFGLELESETSQTQIILRQFCLLINPQPREIFSQSEWNPHIKIPRKDTIVFANASGAFESGRRYRPREYLMA